MGTSWAVFQALWRQCPAVSGMTWNRSPGISPKTPLIGPFSGRFSKISDGILKDLDSDFGSIFWTLGPSSGRFSMISDGIVKELDYLRRATYSFRMTHTGNPPVVCLERQPKAWNHNRMP